MPAEPLVSMFADDTVWTFERADELTVHTFGGPLEVNFLGDPPGDRPLQMVALLHLYQIPQLRLEKRFTEIPLFYGFTYEGCEIRYRYNVAGRIEVLDFHPSESSDDFPYANYPSLLPYVPLRITEPRQCSYAEFSSDFPNMPDEQAAELIIVVPPPATLGVSLWGRWGDGEGVVVVFECNLSEGIVRVTNRCD